MVLISMQKFSPWNARSWNVTPNMETLSLSQGQRTQSLPPKPTVFAAALSERQHFLCGQLKLPSLYFLLSVAVLLLQSHRIGLLPNTHYSDRILAVGLETLPQASSATSHWWGEQISILSEPWIKNSVLVNMNKMNCPLHKFAWSHSFNLEYGQDRKVVVDTWTNSRRQSQVQGLP